MATIQIQCTDTRSTVAVVEQFQRGSNGQADALVRRGRLVSGAISVVLPSDGYVKVHEVSEDEGKSIDNW